MAYTKTDTSPLVTTSGDDLILVDDPANAVQIDGGAGFDELRLTATVAAAYVLGADITGLEKIVIGTGEDADADTSGEAAISVDATDVGNGLQIVGNAGANAIDGTSFDDFLTGGAGNDTLNAGQGGFDFLQGGSGDDTYYWYVIRGVTISEDVDGGIDTVIYDYTGAGSGGHTGMSTNTENVVLTNIGEGGRPTLTGNDFDNDLSVDPASLGAATLVGGIGNDTLTGGSRADGLHGGDGDDSMAGGSGFNSFFGGAGSDTMLGGNDGGYYEGQAGADSMVGGDGADHFVGGEGVDTMAGGAGDDAYADYDPALDLAVEEPGGGTDTLVVSAATFTLPDVFENLILNGISSGTGHGIGNALDNAMSSNMSVAVLLQGLGGDDSLTGSQAADTLSGGTGVDTMAGSRGDDLYIVDNSDDDVRENAPGKAGDEGNDTVRSSADYLLPDNVENLELSGAADVDGTGNSKANSLTGNAGSNVLDGGLGNDTMSGGAGDDFFVATRGDSIFESASGGIDTVVVSADWTLAANLEDLVLSGFGNYAGTGNAAANQMIGNTGRNLLNGRGGADQIFGGFGADTGLGGAGNDELYGDAGSDLMDGGDDSDALEGEGGNDTLIGGRGVDVLAGGAGNDLLVWDAADAAADEAVAGGGGKDTLRLQGGNLNLTLLGQDVIQGIERIDLTVATANVLRLKTEDLLALSNTSNALEVAGTAADKVSVADGTWSQGASRTIGTELYDVYVNGSATLVVDADIVVTITLGP